MKCKRKQQAVSIFLCLCFLISIFAQLLPGLSVAAVDATVQSVDEIATFENKQAVFGWWSEFTLASDVDDIPGVPCDVAYEDLITDTPVVVELIGYHYDDVKGEHWYKVGARSGETLPAILADNPWVLYATDIDIELVADPYLNIYEMGETIRFVTSETKEYEVDENGDRVLGEDGEPIVIDNLINYYVLSGPTELQYAKIEITPRDADYPISALAYAETTYGTTFSKALDIIITKSNGDLWSAADGQIAIRYEATQLGSDTYTEDVFGAGYLYVNDQVYSTAVTDRFGYDESDVVYTNNGSSVIVFECLPSDFKLVCMTGYFIGEQVALYNNNMLESITLATLPDSIDVLGYFTYGGAEYYWINAVTVSDCAYFIASAADITFEQQEVVPPVDEPTEEALAIYNELKQITTWEAWEEYWESLDEESQESISTLPQDKLEELDALEEYFTQEKNLALGIVVSPMTITTNVDGIEITVEGNILSGSTLSASPYSITDPGHFGLADISNVKGAYDIKILDIDGNEIQPEDSVFIIMDAAAMGLDDGDVVDVIHEHGSDIETTTHVVINGKLIFPVSGFSVFIVNSTSETTGTQIIGNSVSNPFVMTVGEEKIFFDNNSTSQVSYTSVNDRISTLFNNQSLTNYFYLDGEEYKKINITRTGSNYNYYRYTVSVNGEPIPDMEKRNDFQPQGIYRLDLSRSTYRGEWQVSDESNAIAYEIISLDYNGNNDWQHMAPYITVTAKDAGDVVLTYKYKDNNIRQEILYIKVVAPENPINPLYVDDQVAETGCLVPAGLTPSDVVSYTWSRSDGQTIRTEALHAENGSVNVSLDRGGLIEGRDPITYTVTATLTNGTTQTASYEVLYSCEIMNSSFENTVLDSGLVNQYFYNGYPRLYWKTTTPGSTPSQLTQDIEIITVANGVNTAGSYGENVISAANGNQFAEINAEGFGALYQDILTTPGSDLDWAFSHMSRTEPDDSENTMYVVIGATKYAQHIIDFDDINALLTEAKETDETIPNSGEGVSFTYNGGKYYIWKHVGTETWERIEGTYEVPNEQYLTRLFFVSETANAARVDATCGNLIDDVTAGETMDYKIEYYVDNALVTADTQTGKATVYTTVGLNNLQKYLNEGYVLTAAKIQLQSGTINYPGNVSGGLYITSYGASNDLDSDVILQVYLSKRAVTITKKIIIEGWSSMTENERTALIGNGLTSVFELKSNSKTYTASLTINGVSATGELIAVGEFVDSSGHAPVNGEYTITETVAPSVSGYGLTSKKFDIETIKITDTSPTAVVVCTNTYKQSLGTLVINKTVTKAYQNDTLPNHTFYFTVSGMTDGTYNVKEGGVSSTVTASGGVLEVSLSGFTSDLTKTITISDVPAGSYTVTETPNNEYTTTGGGPVTVPAGGTGTVSFTNEYKRHLFDLTIKKEGANMVLDVNQSFIFDVTGPKGFVVTVVINGNNSVTIKDLPQGTYTVTEKDNWSWRYTPDAPKKSVILSDAGENTVKFINNRSEIYWLDGDSYCENWWGGNYGANLVKRNGQNVIVTEENS